MRTSNVHGYSSVLRKGVVRCREGQEIHYARPASTVLGSYALSGLFFPSMVMVLAGVIPVDLLAVEKENIFGLASDPVRRKNGET